MYRLESSRQLVRKLKVLFAKMTKSDKKYADPTDVLKSLTDDFGKPVEIGEEKDIGEFNDTFLSRVQEGLNYKQLYQQMLDKKNEQKQGEANAPQASEANSNQKAKAVNLSLRAQDSSINFEENDADPQIADQDMKDEQQLKQKEDTVEIVGK